MKKLIISLLLSLITLTYATSALAVNSALDQAGAGLQEATNQAYGGGKEVKLAGDPLVSGLVTIINFLLTFTGVIFLLLLIYGGWLWMTARGNESQLEKAKSIVKEVIIGLIIIILARLFTEFILYQLAQSI